MGLVKQCVKSHHRKNIQRLTMTFMTLSLEDMANRVKLSNAGEAEKYVMEMVTQTRLKILVFSYQSCLHHMCLNFFFPL
jgi:hypothetical protein